VRLIRLTESVGRAYCTAIEFTATSSAVEIINRLINFKLTNISTFNNELLLLNTSHLIQGGLKKYKWQITFISAQNIDKFLKLFHFTPKILLCYLHLCKKLIN